MIQRKLARGLLLVLVFPLGALAGYGASRVVQWATTPSVVEFGDRSELLGRTQARRVLFSLSTCPYCLRAREWLKANDVEFTELVIDESVDAQRMFEEIDGTGVPVLVMQDRVIRGFAQDEYAAAFGRKADR